MTRRFEMIPFDILVICREIEPLDENRYAELGPLSRDRMIASYKRENDLSREIDFRMFDDEKPPEEPHVDPDDWEPFD